MINLKLDRPSIFGNKIYSGVTQKNIREGKPYGLSFSKTPFFQNHEVLENRKLLAQYLGVKVSRFQFQKQVHLDEINHIVKDRSMKESDAMMTRKRKMLLMVSIADCAAVLLHDEDHQAIAAIHSGWRGSMQKILPKTIALLKKKYEIQSKYLKAYISPCAGVNNYEVGEEFATIFPSRSIEKRGGKYFFNNRLELFAQLIDCGVQPTNIEVSEICTIENENYHSHRRDGEKAGRMVAFIGFRD